MDSLRNEYKAKVAVTSPNTTNRIKGFQKMFQRSDGQPVFLKTRTDVRLYRAIMGFSVVGIGIAFFSIYRMATGQIQKKE